MSESAKDIEVRKNYDAFRKLLPGLLETHPGKFALLRDEKVVEFFDTARDALVFAQSQYADGLFSVQEVNDSVVDLGWYSHAPSYATV